MLGGSEPKCDKQETLTKKVFFFGFENNIRGVQKYIKSSKQQSNYSLFLLSISIVTGPSFNSATFISAPKTPVCTFLPKSFCI